MSYLRFILLGCILACSLIAGAESRSDSIRVLFIGNSYTHYHDMYKMVAEIASHVGQDQKAKVACEAYTPGGCTFKRHLQNRDAIDAIKRGDWDYVVLQEQSSLPAMPTDSVAKNVYPYAGMLVDLVAEYNPDANVIFYMTWGHKYGCQSRHEGYPVIDTYEGMQDRLMLSYLEMAYSNDARCAPVGMAWRRVRAERPYVSLYWPDCSHPSKVGSYLAANVIYTTIFSRPYQCSYFAGLDPELAEYLQQIAQTTVFDNLRLLNISE